MSDTLKQRLTYGVLYCVITLLLLAVDTMISCASFTVIGVALWCETFSRSRQDLWFVAVVTAYFAASIGFWLCVLEKAIASVLCVVWASDTGGYVCGKLIRGPRVFSVLSPRKTYSGYCGALGFAICVGTLVGFNLYQDLLICVVGVIGDLIGSWIKRVKGVKDASSLIPGHGGLLDRFDSVLPLGALLYMIF